MAQADNALFLYRNFADTATVSASSQVTGAEATFAQTIDPGEPWRATGKTSEHIDFDFGAVKDISHAAAVAITSTPTAPSASRPAPTRPS
jgi:hypothetical protein